MKKKLFIWCCDLNKQSGEGILAIKFINDLKKNNKKITIITKNISKKKLEFLRKFFGKLTDRIILPLCGLFYLWYIFIFKKNKRVCYVNFLPLWNFIIFLTLPPKTIFGPITGGSKYLNKTFKNYLFRGILFKFFYSLSIRLLIYRNQNILFSTDLLKKYIHKFGKFNYNYVFSNFKYFDKKFIRKYDIIFYLRKHENKNIDLLIKIAEKLSQKFEIITIGEKIKNSKIKNFGKISRRKLNLLLQQTKYSFLSPENIYSFYSLDCLSNGVHVFYNNKNNPLVEIKSNMSGLNYNNYKILIKKLMAILNSKQKIQKKIIFKSTNNFNNLFKIYF